MNVQSATLLDRLSTWRAALEQPVKLKKNLPPPQLTWALLGLMHYRKRRRWAWRLLKEQTPSQYELLCRMTEKVQIDSKARAFRKIHVPGSPEWECGVCNYLCGLENRESGEYFELDCDFNPDDIRSFDWACYFEKIQECSPLVSRVKSLFPNGWGLETAALLLAWGGLLSGDEDLDSILPDDPPKESAVNHDLCFSVTLGNDVDACECSANDFLRAWSDPENRLALAAHIGDWYTVYDIAANEERDSMADQAYELYEESHGRWLEYLKYVADRHLTEDVSYALAASWSERAEVLRGLDP